MNPRHFLSRIIILEIPGDFDKDFAELQKAISAGRSLLRDL